MLKKLLTIAVIAVSVLSAQRQSTSNAQKGTWNFNPQKLWEISKTGDENFGRPAEPRIGNDEILYVRDFDKKFSYIIDKDGDVTSTFAIQNGENPDIPMYINCFTVDDEVIVAAMDKLYFYNNTGKLLNTLPNNIFVRFPYTFIDANKIFLGPGALAGIPNGTADITLVDVKNNKEQKFAEITLSEVEKNMPPGGVVVGLIPQILMAYDKENGKVYYAKNSDYKIYCADENGNIISSFGRNIPKKFVSIEQKKDHLKFFVGDNMTDEQITQMVTGMPDSLAYFHNMIFNNGLIYVLRMNELSTESHSQEIDIFSTDGKYLYNGAIDFGDYYYQNPGNVQIKDDTMYAILINKNGEKVIVKYKLNIPT